MSNLTDLKKQIEELPDDAASNELLYQKFWPSAIQEQSGVSGISSADDITISGLKALAKSHSKLLGFAMGMRDAVRERGFSPDELDAAIKEAEG